MGKLRGHGRKRLGLTTILMSLFSLPFLAMGLFLGVISASQSDREARDIQRMPELTGLAFRSIAPQEPVALTGRLAKNDAQANWEGFVIYLEQEWVITEDEDSVDGSWETRRTLVPDLQLTFSNETVMVYANPEIKLGGAWHETILHRPEDQELVDGFPAGSIRRVGFMDGDLVTVVGVKRDSGGVTPERLYGGDRAGLIRALRQGAVVQRVLGVVFGLVGVVILVLSLMTSYTRE
ncbi:MAG: hypothetical protein JXA21_11635 [Anaerolineae bacterium]|nr:hypothetical protein [Anaerolineae bacterium]